MNKSPLLKLIDISYTIGRRTILKNISTEITLGPPKVILGPNGAGKTMLMKLCHGLLKPSSGTIFWSKTKNEMFTTKHTMVFQRPLMLRRSVKENLVFITKLKGFDKKNQYEIVERALNLVGMNSFAKTPARSLSQGEQQKIALARAWLLNPEVLFLDEPTANLDPKATEIVEEVVKKISSNGTQVLMTTHNIAQAKRIGSEIYFLYEGKLKERSSSNNFFQNPKTKEARNFLKKESFI